MKVSILIPVYNEEKTIIEILKRVNNEILKIKFFEFEVVVIDDFSNDQTGNLLHKNKSLYKSLIKNEKNYGKGYCIRRALHHINTDIVLIQDADLEYNPLDYQHLLKPFLDFNADVVYGSRFKSGQYSRVLFFWHSLANSYITLLTNIFSNYNLTDVETGYKLFRFDKLKKINLIENDFAFEIEVTLKLSNLKPPLIIYETGINYFGRTYSEGKKIKMRDAFKAIFCILKYGILTKN
jgi:glycosyltransferase involved in cell wall biosynthesis